MSDLLTEMEQDLLGDSNVMESVMPSNDKLGELTDLITQLSKLEEALKKVTDFQEKINTKISEINTMRIPDLFDELGVKKLNLLDGRTVEIIRKFAASISKDKEEQCFNWLKEHNHDAIIKDSIAIKLKKGEGEISAKITKFLNDLQVAFDKKRAVHPQTLLAFVKEQIESGEEFPQELFNVFPLRFTKIK
jgi:ferritin